MNYATETDMRARYREDLLRPLLAVPRSDEPDTRKLNRALTDASALIDSYLSARYTLPLEVIPAVLVQHCCAIAFYYLCDQRASDQARDRYREALAWLKDVMNGNVPVGVDTNGAAPESGDLPQIQSDAAVFGRNQKGFV
ncbi:gp436 family protein [Escherichia coli]